MRRFLLLAVLLAALLALGFGGSERIPICDVGGIAVPGSVVEVRMFVDGAQFDSWKAGMCPRRIDFVQKRMRQLMLSGGPF